MKRERLTILFLVLLSSIFAVTMFVAGCAGDRYTRSSEEYIDDKALNARVTTALNESPEYKLHSVTVQSFRGVVQLSGLVNTPDQRSKAGEIARQIPGVKSVENNIALRAHQELSMGGCGPRKNPHGEFILSTDGGNFLDR